MGQAPEDPKFITVEVSGSEPRYDGSDRKCSLNTLHGSFTKIKRQCPKFVPRDGNIILTTMPIGGSGGLILSSRVLNPAPMKDKL